MAKAKGGLGATRLDVRDGKPRGRAIVAPAQDERIVVDLPIELVDPNPDQPRSYFDHAALVELSESIAVKGVRDPIQVQLVGARYKIVMGERRYRASKMAKKETVPALVIDLVDEGEGFELALIENIQREDMTAFEEATGVVRLMELKGYNQTQVAKALGKSKSRVSRYVKVAGLQPRVAEKVAPAQLGLDQLYAIAQQQGRAQLRLAEQVVGDGMSRQQMRDRKGKQRSRTKPRAAAQLISRVHSLRDDVALADVGQWLPEERLAFKRAVVELSGPWGGNVH